MPEMKPAPASTARAVQAMLRAIGQPTDAPVTIGGGQSPMGPRLPDIDTLAKLLQNADSPRSHNYVAPPREYLTNKDVYAPNQAGNILPPGVLPEGNVIPSELARYLRSLLAGAHPDIPKSPQGGHDG